MNKRQIFIQILKAAVLISVVLAMLPVYIHASYDLGSFSGTFVPIYDKDGQLVDVTPKEFWHTLTITHSGELVLSSAVSGTLSSIYGNAYFRLYKPDKIGILGDALLRDGVITVSNIAPGTYYINVWAVHRYGTYTIQAAFTNADDNLTESEPNDTADTANLLTDTVTGIIGYTDGLKTDTQDWFRYEVTRPGKLVLSSAAVSGTLSSISGNAYFCLYKPDKIGILGDALLRDGIITVSNIAPGTYYIKLWAVYRYGTYTIQAAFTNADDNLTESEPNDTADTANLLTDRATGIIGYTDGLKTDTQDWFRYEVTRPGKLVLSSTGTFSSNSYSYFQLYKPDKSTSLSSGASLINGIITVSNIAPGTYYIKAWTGGTYGTYTIQAAFTNADDNLTESEPNDTADTANLLADRATGIIGYTDGLKTDTQDWFRYEVTRPGKLVLSSAVSGTLSSIYGNAYFRLYKPDKIGILSDALLRDGVITVSNIAPGTYYIKLWAVSRYGTYTIQSVFTPDVSAPGLQDEIVCLRILSGIPVSSSEIIITDISKDGRIGMEECVYILQVVAGLRP